MSSWPRQLSAIAARYQRTRATSSTTRMGMALPAGFIGSFLVGMAGAEAFADAVGDGEELRRLADIERTLGRKRRLDDVGDASRARRHHHNFGREVHRLGDRVGDEGD